MANKSLRFWILGIVILAMAAGGCTQSLVSGSTVVPVETANATADNILNAMNAGSYSDYTKNFSGPMMAAVDVKGFNDARTIVRDTFGDYLSRAGPTSSVIRGYDVFVYDCTFSKGHVKFVLAMNRTNTSMVEGVQFLKP